MVTVTRTRALHPCRSHPPCRLAASALAMLLAMFVAGRTDAATQTLTFSPVADTWVDSSAASSNLNNDVALKVDGSPIAITYLRFTVTGVNGRPVQQARLRLGVSGISVDGGTIHKISN